jgi:epoxyqueuosine reductase QueG
MTRGLTIDFPTRISTILLPTADRYQQLTWERGMGLTAAQVKTQARALGADLVGIASAAVLNAHPPDPAYPQTHTRLWPACRSLVAIAKRIPAGAFRAQNDTCIHHIDQLVLRQHDKIAYRIARYLEQHGHYAFPLAAQETVWAYKRASYGYLSTRHVAVEAGLGTLGLELNLLTKAFGPRCYTTAILTDAALAPDGKLTEQVCIGETCSRCLYSCPVDAVLHWHIDKRACATEAQEYGFSRMRRFFHGLITAPDAASAASMLASVLAYGIWQGLLRVVGAFGDCPRCLAVCPVGDDYLRFLSDYQRHIPEKTPENVTTAKTWCQHRRGGAPIASLQDGRVRWIGELGYRPPGKVRSS